MEKKFKLLYIMISILAVVVLVQSYFIYDFKSALDTNKKEERVVSHDTVFHSKNKPVANDFFSSFNSSSSDPFEEIKRIQEEMQKSFGQFNSIFANNPFFQDAFTHSAIAPLSDMKENDKEYVIEMNIPGASEKNININIKTDDNYLSISALSDNTKEQNKENYIHKERYAQRFERDFTMPADADLQKKTSNYENGVLRIVIPKRN